jgi:hypothetical protein
MDVKNYYKPQYTKIMLKNISNLGSVLSRADQKAVKGGQSFMCAALCGPGDGNTPIYDDPMPWEDPNLPQEVIGCVCA